MCVEIYIKSITYNRDLRHQVYQTRFVSCAQYRTHLPDEGWEGRLLDPGSARIMQVISGLPASAAKSLRIIDVGTLRGRIAAWRSGVRNVPAIVIDGCKFDGLSQTSKALAELAAHRNS